MDTLNDIRNSFAAVSDRDDLVTGEKFTLFSDLIAALSPQLAMTYTRLVEDFIKETFSGEPSFNFDYDTELLQKLALRMNADQ